ncbi:MAG: tetratricopeptide repeat protein [Spirochaetales bacterium]|nr:tetratricopeptide repeat protein [Spirochaetales bacterium]
MRSRITMSGLVPVYLAEIETRDGDIDAALSYLNTFLDSSNDQRELILYRIAALHLSAGRFSEAAASFGVFLDEFSSSLYYAEAVYQNAFSFYKTGEFDDALDLVNRVLNSARGGGLTSGFLLLKSVIHKEKGDIPAAISSLEEYLPLRPDDSRARMDLIKHYFRLNNFPRVIFEIEKVLQEAPFSNPASAYFLLVRYMYGLSFISDQQYDRSTEILSELSLSLVQDADLLVIYPYILYYRGWSNYRMGNYPEAQEDFAALLDGVPDHELQQRAAYLAGWCAYVQGRFSQAATYLLKMGADGDEVLRIKKDFMYAKTLLQQKKTEEAAILFERIYLTWSDSELADDALYEYAGVLSVLDNLEESVLSYQKVADEYPSSLLAEDSMYRRGELLYAAGEYEKARDAFYQYRLRFPAAGLYDAALYWGGLASAEIGEAFGAVLLWEKLIEKFAGSAFRADSLLRTAEVYEESGDFRKALNYYGELLKIYPDEAKAVSAGLRSEKLRFLILGQGEEEAEFSALIEQEGADTKTGRLAIYELARIYIYKSGSKQNLAPDLLDQLIARVEDDPEFAARAYYLYGEYFYRKNELQKAAQSFMQAVLTYPDDKDLSAQALYKAAEMAAISGNRKDAEELVRRIESLFPSSQWVESGRKLLGDTDE